MNKKFEEMKKVLEEARDNGNRVRLYANNVKFLKVVAVGLDCVFLEGYESPIYFRDDHVIGVEPRDVSLEDFIELIDELFVSGKTGRDLSDLEAMANLCRTQLARGH